MSPSLRLADLACACTRRVPLVAAVLGYLVVLAFASAAVSAVRGCVAKPCPVEIAR